MSAAALRSIAARVTTPVIYVLLVILWEACARIFKIPGWILPAPSAILFAAQDWAPELVVFRRLRIPIALPHLFTGCKIAVTFAVIGAVISEFVAAQEGLGYLILISTAQSQTPLAFASIIVLTVISVMLFYAVEFFE